jgi:hypothetical protein
LEASVSVSLCVEADEEDVESGSEGRKENEIPQEHDWSEVPEEQSELHDKQRQEYGERVSSIDPQRVKEHRTDDAEHDELRCPEVRVKDAPLKNDQADDETTGYRDQ